MCQMNLNTNTTLGLSGIFCVIQVHHFRRLNSNRLDSSPDSQVFLRQVTCSDFLRPGDPTSGYRRVFLDYLAICGFISFRRKFCAQG